MMTWFKTWCFILILWDVALIQISGGGANFGQCMGLLPTQHFEEFG